MNGNCISFQQSPALLSPPETIPLSTCYLETNMESANDWPEFDFDWLMMNAFHLLTNQKLDSNGASYK